MNSYPNCTLKPHGWVLVFFLYECGFGLYEVETERKSYCPQGWLVTSHSDILTNQILMFKVSVVSETARTGAQTHTATYWAIWELPPQ